MRFSSTLLVLLLLVPLGMVSAAGRARFGELRQAPPVPAGGFAALRPLEGEEGLQPKGQREWRKVQERLRREWQERLGPFPARVPLGTEVLSTEELADHMRRRLRYRVDGQTWAEAYLLTPKGFEGRRPGMVILHATSATSMRDPVGLDGRETMHMALRLVRRGYACIAPRNFLWSEPDAQGKFDYQRSAESVLKRYRTGMARMTWDAIRATDVLAEQPEVDRERLGSMGHSLGGKEALYHAAFDPRIRAAVSCEGGIGIRFSNWEADWYLGPQVKADGFRPDHQEVLALVAPRAFLLIGGGSADGAQSWPYVEAALPAWRAYGAEERLGLMVHPEGHDFPKPGPLRERVQEWLDTWLADS